MTALIVLVTWFVVSVFVALFIGRAMGDRQAEHWSNEVDERLHFKEWEKEL